MPGVRPPALPPEERWIAVMVLGLAAYPAWLRGGTHAPWTRPLLFLAALLLSVLIILSWIRSRRAGARAGERSAPFIRVRDPVFWFGLSLLLLLAVQWWNSGRVLFFDASARQWTYSPARHPSLPSAITSGEARQMLDWFFPAWVILLALRSPGLSGRAVRFLWRGLACNAGLIALFGILQYASGSTRMYGIIPMRPHFFASFGYPNHAGSYFLLAMCLSAGLLSWDLEGQSRARKAALGAAFFLCLVGANLSLSRIAILLSWVLLVPLGACLLFFFWRGLTAARRLNLVAASLAVFCLAALFTFGLGREAIRREFQPEDDQKTLVERETSFRGFQIQAAVRIWRDHKWFGVGGWGYRYLLAHYLPPQEWRRVTEGKANVHNDPVQFLAEFGLFGAGAMAAVVLCLVAGAHRRSSGYPPLVLFPLLGCGLVGLQSLIDLPFRSPAVLYLWLIGLAGAARVIPRGGKQGREARPPQNQLNVAAGNGKVPVQRGSP